jgi:hypothetical protein
MTNTNTQANVQVNTGETAMDKRFKELEAMGPEKVIISTGGKDRGNISKAIRRLHGEGFSKGQIAKLTGKRFQHIRNVLVQPLKSATPTPTPTPTSEQGTEPAATGIETKKAEAEASAPAKQGSKK